MIIFPHCKINIGLNILRKRSDGYHDLESVMYPIHMYDVLEITQSEYFEFKISGVNIEGNQEDNLCVKAYRLLEKKYKIPPVFMHLRKQIPFGAGLGGGSSDATFVLLELNRQFNLGLGERDLQELSAQLGSDCAFFVRNEPQLATGRGELLRSVALNLKGYNLKLVNPGVHISTQQAFQGVHISRDEGQLINAINLPIDQWKDSIKNDFEKHIFELHPELSKIKQQLYNEGAIYASMSGSGSSFYAIYAQQPIKTFDNDYLELIINL